MPKGGYRKPGNPAPVSGPGALSRRTDGGPTQVARKMGGGQYGESKALMEQQQAAPMAGRAPMPTGKPAPAAPVRPTAPVTPLTAASLRPNEPITAGIATGAGPGPEALGSYRPQRKLSSVIQKIMPNDSSGELYQLYDYLTSRGL
jgi:hypothetical protein